MSLKVTLYHAKNDDISVTIEARFDGDSLVVEGYDIGKQVKEYWGDADYEYSVTVSPLGVDLLIGLFQLPVRDKQSLLNELSKRFNTHSAYSDFRRLLDDHKIPHEGFSWI